MLARGIYECERCGSPRIRRARSHTPWQRLVSALTPLERYACGACTHRGWRVPSDKTEHQAPAGLPLRPRPIEERNHRKRMHARRQRVRGILVAVLLGVLAALVFVVR